MYWSCPTLHHLGYFPRGVGAMLFSDESEKSSRAGETGVKNRSLLLAILGLSLLFVEQAHADYLYDNGQPDGSYTAYNINSGGISNSFKLTSTSHLANVQITVTVPFGATPDSVQWSIGIIPFGSEISSGRAQFTNTLLNPGLEIYSSTFPVSNTLPPGTYWLTIDHARSDNGYYIYWERSGGSSLAVIPSGTPGGPPSVSLPSESFQIIGEAVPASPEPSSLVLFVIGGIGAAAFRWRRYRTLLFAACANSARFGEQIDPTGQSCTPPV